MGYSARYHAFSIIAVFAALAVGIVIGAGLGSDFVSGTTKNLEESLRQDVNEARQREDQLSADLKREQGFGAEVYPALVGEQMKRDRIALVSLGALPDDVAQDVEAGLAPTGAQVERVASVRLPPDLGKVAEALGDTRLGRLAGDPARRAELGEILGRQLARGGALLTDAREPLLERFSGHADPVDRVVVVRSIPDGLDSVATQAADEFVNGILKGLETSGVPVAAVERTDASPSSIKLFDEAGIPTVDSVDLTSGRVAMVYALLGAQGNFGIKDTADSLLPELLQPPARTDAQQGAGHGSGKGRKAGQRGG